MRLDAQVPEFGRTLGEELLEPTRIYAKDCLALIAETEVHALRSRHRRRAGVEPGPGAASRYERHRRSRQLVGAGRVHSCIAERGHVAAEEMERTFNLGVGMIALVAADDADRALATLLGRHVPAWVAGTVAAGESDAPGSVDLVGKHPD